MFQPMLGDFIFYHGAVAGVYNEDREINFPNLPMQLAAIYRRK